jgi:hypothetical protein
MDSVLKSCHSNNTNEVIVLFMLINIGHHLEGYKMGLQYLYWQTGVDVATKPAKDNGKFFHLRSAHILNLLAPEIF